METAVRTNRVICIKGPSIEYLAKRLAAYGRIVSKAGEAYAFLVGAREGGWSLVGIPPNLQEYDFHNVAIWLFGTEGDAVSDVVIAQFTPGNPEKTYYLVGSDQPEDDVVMVGSRDDGAHLRAIIPSGKVNVSGQSAPGQRLLSVLRSKGVPASFFPDEHGFSVAAQREIAVTRPEAVKKPIPRVGVPGQSAILPRIKHQSFLAAPGNELAVTAPLAADLLVSFAFDIGSALLTVQKPDLQRLTMRPDELYKVAVANLRARATRLSLQGDAPLKTLKIGNDLEACALLLDDLWSRLAPQVPGEVVVAVPARDLVLITSSKSEGGLRKMREIVKEVIERERVHGLTDVLLTWRGGKWEVFVEPPLQR